MSTADSHRHDSQLEITNAAWETGIERSYECRVRLCPDETGGYYAIALNLPGVVSEGETEAEAIANIKDACALAIGYFLDTQNAIPWSHDEDPADQCAGSKEFWVRVNV